MLEIPWSGWLACVQNSMEGPGVKIMLEISWEGYKKGFFNRVRPVADFGPCGILLGLHEV